MCCVLCVVVLRNCFGYDVSLIVYPQRREIEDVVREICEHAHKPDHTSFAFKFVENDNYITNAVRDGLLEDRRRTLPESCMNVGCMHGSLNEPYI